MIHGKDATAAGLDISRSDLVKASPLDAATERVAGAVCHTPAARVEFEALPMPTE